MWCRYIQLSLALNIFIESMLRYRLLEIEGIDKGNIFHSLSTLISLSETCIVAGTFKVVTKDHIQHTSA